MVETEFTEAKWVDAVSGNKVVQPHNLPAWFTAVNLKEDCGKPVARGAKLVSICFEGLLVNEYTLADKRFENLFEGLREESCKEQSVSSARSRHAQLCWQIPRRLAERVWADIQKQGDDLIIQKNLSGSVVSKAWDELKLQVEAYATDDGMSLLSVWDWTDTEDEDESDAGTDNESQDEDEVG